MSQSLPARPSLRQLHIQAKELAAALKSGNAEALARFTQATGRNLSSPPKLSDAQWAIARENGFENWAALETEVLARESRALEPVLEEFRRAVRSGDVPGFQSLLKAHPVLKTKLNDGLFDFESPAIRTAVQRKDLAMVDALLAAGADINQRSYWAPGSFGVLDGADDEIAAQLIARGATVDIHAAAHLGQLERLRQLLDSNPGLVNARGGDGGTPLHFARDLPTTNVLLERGADVQIRDLDHGSTAAMWQVRNREILYRLIEAGSPIDIFMACVHGDLDLAKRALQEDPDCLGAYVGHGPNKGKFAADTGGDYYLWQIGQGARPIPVAVKFQHTALAEFLLSRAGPTDHLIGLCAIGDPARVEAFLRQNPGALPAPDQSGAGAIMSAMHFRDRTAARMLIEIGFPLTARGVSGGTALHLAAWIGDAELVELLLRKGAELEVKNDDKNFQSTPLEWACHGSRNYYRSGPEDYGGVVRALLGAGADTSYLPEIPAEGAPDWAAPEVIEAFRNAR